MHSLATRLLLLALSFLALFSSSGGVSAADTTDSTAAASVFVYDNADSGQQFVFALNIDPSTSDLYLHLSAPAGNSWMGVGIGSQMKDSLFFVAYASKNGTGMTLSPRTTTGHTEPAHYKDVTCDLVWDDGLADGNTVTDTAMTVNAVCHNALKWPQGSLNTDSQTQPFIFAVGPSEGTGSGPSGHGASPLHSDSLSAGLRRHDFYGHFTMDLTAATTANSSAVGVPKPNSSSSSSGSGNSTYVLAHASQATGAQADNDPAPAIHGFIMCLVFVIIYPLGALLLRALQRVILHAVVQTIGLVLTCMATAGGCVVSTQYVKSKHFASAHQIIGILLLLALFGQLGLGILHHRIFKREQRPTTLGKIHLYLGPAIILFGVINAPIGFVFAGNPHLCLPYVVILILVIIGYVFVRFFSHICCKGRRNAQKNGPAGPSAGGPEGYQYPQFGPGGSGGNTGYGQQSASFSAAAPPYEHNAPPPAYGRQDSYVREDVPLRAWESRESGVGNVSQAAHPRPMV